MKSLRRWNKMSAELDIDQSYAVLEWMTLSMKKVASNPNLLGKFLFDYIKQLPEIIDAVMTLTPQEHRGVVAELLKASGVMSREVLLSQTKK